ncbi:MAG TPA: VanZ family protein [Phycisphaerae bacterium]|nr:VanZ family protein [Phycisphaerae bacterium]HOJ73170.1 VanZ family protein [Phycisphaerae bacterium]HOM52177.1 VanZ family protein [Phycisphaerae bacterium]HON67004.1 VanZ family protein [Phycisphaerae bacterium]HOQ85448.1 VanZ family protein [Phycisphaerae bacterium]
MPAFLPQVRFDDRSPESLRVGLAVKPPVLRRRTLVILAVLMVAGVIYGTLVPFQFKPSDTAGWRLTMWPLQPGNALANVLVYVPLGIFVRLVLRRRGSRWYFECAATTLVAFVISYGCELLQQFLPGRVPTLTDTLCNVFGAFVGALLAPLAQRRIRQFHAWLYQALQTTPFTAAAGFLGVAICIYALAPFDLRPTPGHVLAGLSRLHASLQAGSLAAAGLSPPAVLNKWMAAGACGVLAFLLTMAARETGRSRPAAAWYALTRSWSLVAVLELVQLFTVSHVADGHDLLRGWACCSAGTLAAAALLWLRPLIYRDPAALVSPIVPIICPIVFLWLAVSAFRNVGGGHTSGLGWLPVMGNFSRSWDSVLGSYTSGFLNYALAVGVLVAWLRLRGHAPRLSHCIATGLLAALSLQAVTVVFFGAFPDTSHIALAVLAGGLVHRVDRAMFGFRVARVTTTKADNA